MNSKNENTKNKKTKNKTKAKIKQANKRTNKKESPPVLRSTTSTTSTAKLVLEMLELDLSWPMPQKRRYPVEGILLAKLNPKSAHQEQFVALLNKIYEITQFWSPTETKDYLVSLLQRYHQLITRIMDKNWKIHAKFYEFCNNIGVLDIGAQTQESSLIKLCRIKQYFFVLQRGLVFYMCVVCMCVLSTKRIVFQFFVCLFFFEGTTKIFFCACVDIKWCVCVCVCVYFV